MGNLKPICHYLQTSSHQAGSPRGNTLALTRSGKMFSHGPENLFAFVEPADGSGSAAYAAELATKAVREAYSQCRESSATGLLQRVTQAANTALWKWNSEQNPRDRRYAGLICALVRGSKVYIVQTGSGQAYFCNQDQIVSIPPRSASRRARSLLGSGGAGSLGMLPSLDAEVQTFDCGNGDTIILGPSDLGTLVRPSDAQRGLFGPKTSSVIDFLKQRAYEYQVDIEGCLVIRLESTDKVADVLPVFGRASKAAGTVKRKAKREQHEEEENDRPARSRTPRSAAASSGAAKEKAPQSRRSTTTRETHVVSTNGYYGDEHVYEESIGAVRARQRRRSSRSRSKDSAFRTVLMIIQMFFGGLLARLLPDTAYERLCRVTGKIASGRWLTTIAAVTIALIILTAWSASYISDRRTSGEIAAKAARVDRILAAVSVVKNDSDIRQMLEQAVRELDASGEAASRSEALTTRRQLVLAGMDQVNHVIRLTSAEQLLDTHSKVDGPSRLGKVIVGNSISYILDTGAGSIYAYNLTSHGFERIMGQDWVVDGQQVGMIQQIGWRAGSLFFVDANNDVYLFNPEEHSWHRYRLQGADEWGSSRQVVSFNDNIYVMSAGQNQVWKYSSGSLGDPPQTWLTSVSPDVDLGKVRQMAVDGQVYLMMADGALLKLSEGRLEEKWALGTYPELLSPVDMMTTASGSTLYIVDGYNRRIVIVSKDGKEQWQLLPPDKSTLFDDIRSVYVDDALRMMWVVSGSKLLQIPLPAEIPAAAGPVAQ